MAAPNSRRNLDEAIKRLAARHGDLPLRIRDVLANTVVAQMLPECAVKGGSGIKLRLGDVGTRFTTDLDVARSNSLDSFEEALQERLRLGWEGFSGRSVRGRAAQPKGVPAQYVMQPFAIKLAYKSKPWCTVQLEVGHNEIGDADEVEYVLASDVSDMFVELGFPRPRPIPLMALHHQIAQKLHALTEPGSMRAHDLIDLQILSARTDLEFTRIRAACERLFVYRNMQPWPSFVHVAPGWCEAYEMQSYGLPVYSDIDDAIVWINELIAKISGSL